jgi:iron complex outermembrane receptor protein
MTNEGVTRHFPLPGGADVYVGAEHHYQGAMYGGACNLAQSRVPSWNEFNFRLGYDSGGRWTAALYLQNAFDSQHFERGWENADANNQGGYGLVNTLVWPSKPRTVGARVDYRW